MILLALEDLGAATLSTAVALWLVQLDADPDSLVLAFDLSDVLDGTLLAFVLERNKGYPLADIQIVGRHLIL